MKKIIALSILIATAQLSYSQDTTKIVVIGKDTLVLTPVKFINNSVRAFSKVEQQQQVIDTMSKLNKLRKANLENANWLVEKRTKQVADSTLKIQGLEKKIAKTNKINNVLTIYVIPVLVLTIAILLLN
jgi:hypothetical protein